MIISISIFLLLTAVEAIYIWILYDKISNALDIAEFVKDTAEEHFGDNDKVKRVLSFSDRVVNIIKNFRDLIWLPIVLVLCINMTVAFILGMIINIVLILLNSSYV